MDYYFNLSNDKKREILWQYYISNSLAQNAVKRLAFDVKKNLKNPIINKFLNYNTIISFLINGCLAYEKISNNEYKEIDPQYITFVSSNRWYQDIPTTLFTNKKELNSTHNLVYISYNKIEISFLESIYIGVVNPSDISFILQHTDYILQSFEQNIIDFKKVNKSKEFERLLKINRLKTIN